MPAARWVRSLHSNSILRYSSLYVVRLEFLYVETAISLWWDSSLTSLKLFGTGSAERISNHSIDRMRTIWNSMICLSYCRPIGNVCSKTSNFERPKKAIFESDKEISENGQRDFLKCKASYPGPIVPFHPWCRQPEAHSPYRQFRPAIKKKKPFLYSFN